MYYRDQYGNITEYSDSARYATPNMPGGYYPVTREEFSFQDVSSWFDKYKMWFLYALIAVVVFIVLLWLWNKNRNKKSVASVFY